MLCVAACLVLSGCNISTLNFEAESVVDEDGAIARAICLRAGDDAKRKEIETHYLLPASGKWIVKPIHVVAEGTGKQEVADHESTFVSRRAYRPTALPATDFLRRTPNGIAFSENRFKFQVANKCK